MNLNDTNQITPEERAAIAREKSKAISSIVLLAGGVGIWAGSIFIDGGYTTQPEYHGMWRAVALLPAFWGIILLLIYRYSWTCIIGALVLSVSGFYLASAPTVPEYAARRVKRGAEEARTISDRGSRQEVAENQTGNRDEAGEEEDEMPREDQVLLAKENEIKSLLNFCRDIQQERGKKWKQPSTLEAAPCTIDEMERRRARFEDDYYRRHPDLVRNQ